MTIKMDKFYLNYVNLHLLQEEIFKELGTSI